MDALQRGRVRDESPMAKLRAGIRNAERGLRMEQDERCEEQGLRRQEDYDNGEYEGNW
jgi:hypothetical protein